MPCSLLMVLPLIFNQSLQPTIQDNCMHDIQYNDDTISREEDADDAMASAADDEMEDDDCDGRVLCRGQKRRLHTVCEISHAARSKMIKQIDHGIT